MIKYNKFIPQRYIYKIILLISLLLINIECVKEFFTSVQKAHAYDKEIILDIKDPIGDDKGPGYYQYPLDKRIRRGTFDIKRFTVLKENSTYVFKIQMREYIMTHWPKSFKSNDQGFVVNMFDIYIDLDGLPYKGYNEALPSREVLFSDNKGWEKVILVTPLSYTKAYEILKAKTDNIDFQDKINDIILPDYVDIQRDKIIIRISESLIGDISNKSGFQCFAMGFSEIVSPNRLLNMDVRSFSTFTDFGGGYDTYGDPPIIDLILPENCDQYTVLRSFRSTPSRYDIIKVQVPFVYSSKNENLQKNKEINQDNSKQSLSQPDNYGSSNYNNNFFRSNPQLSTSSQIQQFVPNVFTTQPNSVTKPSYSFDSASSDIYTKPSSIQSNSILVAQHKNQPNLQMQSQVKQRTSSETLLPKITLNNQENQKIHKLQQPPYINSNFSQNNHQEIQDSKQSMEEGWSKIQKSEFYNINSKLSTKYQNPKQLIDSKYDLNSEDDDDESIKEAGFIKLKTLSSNKSK